MRVKLQGRSCQELCARFGWLFYWEELQPRCNQTSYLTFLQLHLKANRIFFAPPTSMGFGSGSLCLQGYLSFLELFHCLNLLSIFTARLLSPLTPAGQLQKLFVPSSCWYRSSTALSKLAVHVPECPLLQLVPYKTSQNPLWTCPLQIIWCS